MSEIRYSKLKNVFPDQADEIFSLAEQHAKERYQMYKQLASFQY